MAYGNINVDTVTTSTTGGILGAGNASIMKNRIINGAMVIDQRNAGASYSAINGGYSLDRWFNNSFTSGATTGKFTVQQNAGSVTAPVGFPKYLGVTSSAATSSSAGDIYAIGQFIEGYNIADLNWGTANGQPIVISFQVRSSATGTFGLYIRNENNDYNYPTTYTINSANTWETKTVSIPAPTTGTWNITNGIGIGIYFQLQVGSSFTATAGSWITTAKYGVTGCVNLLNNSGATFYITGVQLEVGSSATGFEYVNYQTSLANCQRYYYLHANLVDDPIGMAANTTASQLYTTVQFPQRMRTDPTLSAASGTDFYAFFRNGADDLINSLTIDLVSPTTASLKNSTEVSGTAGQAGLLYCRGSFTGVVAFQAEL